MSGKYLINPLEPKTWDEAGSPEDLDAPQTFRIRSRLSQHISFLKDFFCSYKDFTDREIDVIEIMLQKLYTKWGISDQSPFDRMVSTDYPILSDLYAPVSYTHLVPALPYGAGRKPCGQETPGKRPDPSGSDPGTNGDCP